MDYKEYDDLVLCPWCPNQHEVQKKRLEIHYSKLKQNRDPCVKNLRTCRYNSHHKFHKKEENMHYAECLDAKRWSEREALSQQFQSNQSLSQTAYNVSKTQNDLEENWDEECSMATTVVPARSFGVVDDYRTLYDHAYETPAPPENVNMEKVKSLNPKKKLGIAEKPTVLPCGKETQTSEDQFITHRPQTSANKNVAEFPAEVEALDNKKSIRKLEKKLKEIRKLEEKAANSENAVLTKEEKEKVSKRDDIEKLLADLKLDIEKNDS